MADNLHDRIICALLPLRCDLEEPCEECRILACQDADAVIDAIGLRREYDPHSEPESPRHRYVTEWQPDA